MILNDFLSLIFPRICFACGNSLIGAEEMICTHCEFTLPRTNFCYEKYNPVYQVLAGRVKLYSATAYYYFLKDSRVQNILHQLKYKGKKELGHYLGEKCGKELIKSDFFSTIDIIIPVPLHPKKLRKRGYNQSEYFARGLAESMQSELDISSLARTQYTLTQTKKSRYARWENVDKAFELNKNAHLAGKHLLLVDDVITTGSTLESCVGLICSLPGVKISIAAIAFAIK